MQITVNVKLETIRDLFVSAIESDDPVTTASRGGWCAGFYWRTKESEPPRGLWYNDKPGWYGSSAFQMQIDEVSDERKGTIKSHIIRGRHLRAGLAALAVHHPGAFANVLKGETDAADADSFAQCVTFGKLVYG